MESAVSGPHRSPLVVDLSGNCSKAYNPANLNLVDFATEP
jgi:hypothetical protein